MKKTRRQRKIETVKRLRQETIIRKGTFDQLYYKIKCGLKFIKEELDGCYHHGHYDFVVNPPGIKSGWYWHGTYCQGGKAEFARKCQLKAFW